MSDRQTAARLRQDATAAITTNHHLQYTPRVPDTSTQAFLACLFTDIVEAIGEALAVTGPHSCCEGERDA